MRASSNVFRVFRLCGVAAASVALLLACGGGDSDGAAPSRPDTPSPSPSPTPQPSPVPPVPVPTPVPPTPHPQPNPTPSDPSAPAPAPKPNRAGRLDVSGQARVGSVLTATLTDEDGVPSAVAYQWFSGGQPIADAIESSYRLQAGDAGRAVYVQAVYTDLLGHAETVRSAPTAAVLTANLQGAISIQLTQIGRASCRERV